MKLHSTEIDDKMVKLTYTDGASPEDATKVLIIRMPFEGTMQSPILWHQMNALHHAYAIIDVEMERMSSELNQLAEAK